MPEQILESADNLPKLLASNLGETIRLTNTGIVNRIVLFKAAAGRAFYASGKPYGQA
jgi:hypothetical protein